MSDENERGKKGEQQEDGSEEDLTPSLIVRLREGDPHAGSLLERVYRKPLTRFCWSYLGTLPDAEDAAQEVLVRVLRVDTVPDNFRAWLYRIARNYCISALRTRARRGASEALPSDCGFAADQTGHMTRMIKKEMRSRMMNRLDALPIGMREVLRLRYVEELSRQEIAYVMDMSTSAVKSRIYQGLKELRDLEK